MDAFERNTGFTLGAEEEYQICDPDTGALLPLAPAFMKAVPEALRKRVSYELLHTVIEGNTGVCATVEDAVRDVAETRRLVNEALAPLGGTIGMGSTHPFARWQDQRFVDTIDYRWVGDQLRVVAQRNLTFALHVHVAAPSGEAAVYAANGVRRWYGPLLAMSGNSPFFEGADTGFQSFRTQLFGAFPRTGVPPEFRDYKHFEDVTATLVRAESITKPRQVWWAVRPHPGHGTVELRMFDEQHSLERTAGLLAISQALVAAYVDRWERGAANPALEREYLEDGRWKGMRFGLQCKVVDPASGEVLPMREFADRLVEFVRPRAEAFGTVGRIERLLELLEKEGAGADLQRRVYERAGRDLRALQKWCMAQALAG